MISVFNIIFLIIYHSILDHLCRFHTLSPKATSSTYRTQGFIHDTLFSRISRKLLDSWKFISWTATSQVKCIISYWNKEGSSWKFKRELSACNQFVKISHREKYPAYGMCFVHYHNIASYNLHNIYIVPLYRFFS